MKSFIFNDQSSSVKYMLPYAPLGIVCLIGSHEMGGLINSRILEWRNETADMYPEITKLSPDYIRDSYLVSHTCSRFATGEGKLVINESIRNNDIYILADISNYSCTYTMYGKTQIMSPDDHFQNIKRAIGALNGKARRITVIMPMLYEGRQDKRNARESLDCAIALQELINMGAESIITFDAHEPRVQNAIPLHSFESLNSHYQIIKALFRNVDNLIVDKDNMLVVSPDEGGLNRSIYYASILGLNVSMFYKRRDYSRVVNGKNPIISHEYLGDDLEGKDVLIADDIISSGDSMLDVATELKKRNANRIFIAVTFGQFTQGVQKFHDAYDEGLFDKLLVTNLSYRTPEVLAAPWLVDVDMTKFLSYLIETLNHEQSISSLIDPSEKINTFIAKQGQLEILKAKEALK